MRRSILRAAVRRILRCGAFGLLALTVLAPGDLIHIEVFRQKDLSGDFPIAADGSITHPLYRELKVAGLPLAVVEDRLRSFLAHYETDPTFVIWPLFRVIVSGEVRQPNIYQVPPGTTVAQAIAMAGGPTDRGQLEKVRVMREQASMTLDLLRPDGANSRTQVHSGDQIIIARKRNFMEYVGPASSVLAALAGITTVIIQLRR